MASIVIDLDDTHLGPYLDEIVKRTTDWRPVLRRLGAVAMRKSAQKFAQQGPGWAPLSKATLARRRGGGANAKILQDTGRLRQSVVAADQRAAGSVYRLTQTSLEVGSNLVYAAIHQFGGTIQHFQRPATRTLSFARRGNRFSFATADGRVRGQRGKVALQARAGSSGYSARIPARPFLPTLDDMREEFVEILVDYLNFKPGA